MGVPISDDMLIGHRMRVDQEFSPQVASSRFTNAEWDLIMSVVRFTIDEPSDPASASIEPDLEGLSAAILASEEMRSQGRQGRRDPTPRGSDGMFDRVKGMLGLGSSVSKDRDERTEAAAGLVRSYAAMLEVHLREEDLWEELCTRVAEAEGPAE